MSQWTHVAGTIRIDGIAGLTPPPTIGKLPEGSEGPLEIHIETKQNSAAAYAISIWGDLRDYGEGECEEIHDWLEALTNGAMVRNLCVEARVEYGPTIHWTWEEPEEFDPNNFGELIQYKVKTQKAEH